MGFDARFALGYVLAVHNGEGSECEHDGEAGDRHERDRFVLPRVGSDPLRLRDGRQRQVVLARGVPPVILHELLNGDDGATLVDADRVPDQIRVIVRNQSTWNTVVSSFIFIMGMVNQI